jgi:hypothetical protein
MGEGHPRLARYNQALSGADVAAQIKTGEAMQKAMIMAKNGRRSSLEKIARGEGFYAKQAAEFLKTCKKPPAKTKIRWVPILPGGRKARTIPCRTHQFGEPRYARRETDIRRSAVPAGLAGWYAPAFDDSSWRKDTLPISKTWKRQAIMVRAAFTFDDTDYARLALEIDCRRTAQVYLNGSRVANMADVARGATIPLKADAAGLLKRGRNVLAVMSDRRGDSRLSVRLLGARK